MKHIHYDGTSILTGDDIADAVIEYAAALAGGDQADTIEVPAVGEDGTLAHEKILIGPSSEIVVSPAEDDELEPEDPTFVSRLQGAAKVLGHHEPVHASERPEYEEQADQEQSGSAD